MLAALCIKIYGRVFAYEPNLRMLKLISKTMIMNWMHDRIVIRPVIVGEVAGNVRLAFTPETSLADAQVAHKEIVDSTFNENISQDSP